MRTLYASLLVFVLFFVSTFTYAFSYEGELKVSKVTDASISVSWDADDSASNYIVYYDYTDTLDPDDPQYFEQSDPTSNTSIEIDALESDTYYSFVVVSLDDSGVESENYSNQVTVKTFKKKPPFELSTNEIIVSDSKTVIVPFTRVIETQSDVDIKITHIASDAQLFVKWYLPGVDDLRKLQVFLSDELRMGDEYLLEVTNILDKDGNSMTEEALRTRTFGADFEIEKIGDVDAQDGGSEQPSEPEPEPVSEPVPIDTLPNTWPGLFGLIFLLVACGVVGYVFFRFRRT